MNSLVFIVDDDPFHCKIVSNILAKNEINNVKILNSGEDCLQHLDQQPNLIFLDYEMSGMNGIDVLNKVKYSSPNTTVVMISAQEKVEVAINAIKLGAFNYVVKNQNLFENINKTINELRQLTILSEV